MKIEVHNSCSDFDSYRAARVKSLFNAETGANFDLLADLPVDDKEWSIGLVVGPSGSGKTSIGRTIWGGDALADFGAGWPHDKPIIDAISPDGDFDAVTSALAAVGLGSVPTWLRPYPVISNGEQFRANLARVICEAPERVVIDEFTSVVDRQIAQVGASAFAKAWRRAAAKDSKQCVLLSCHYDIIDWLEPDWVFDTGTGKYSGRSLWRRPHIELEIWRTNWSFWKMFEPHHYLKADNMVAGECYVGTVNGVPVAHCAISPRPGVKEWRMARIVVMPEWQGVGIGTRFITAICESSIRGEGRYNRPMPTLINTSHPGLCAYFRRDKNWVQLSAKLHGLSVKKALDRAGVGKRYGQKGKSAAVSGAVGGGHFRAIQGFRYLGEYSPRHKSGDEQ